MGGKLSKTGHLNGLFAELESDVESTQNSVPRMKMSFS